jgi:hypothetical protein
MLPDQWNKGAGSMILLLETGFSLNDSNQALRLARFAYRHHEAATNFQLRNEWPGNGWATSGY